MLFRSSRNEYEAPIEFQCGEIKTLSNFEKVRDGRLLDHVNFDPQVVYPLVQEIELCY